MADSFIIIDEPAVTDKKLDTTQLTVGANTVERERVNITGAAATDICPVDATKGLRVDLTNSGTNSNAFAVTLASISTSVVPGTAATNLGKAEDAAHTSADVGVMALGVRNDSNAALTDTNGDYSPLATNSKGTLFVTNETGSSIGVNLSADSLGLTRAEDAQHSTGHLGIMSLAVRNATATDLSAGGTDGDYEPLQVDANGALHVIGRANASTNVAQLAGTATSVNSGTKDAGTLRVVIATDQPQLTNKLLVTPDANSAVNVAQINGVAPLMGNGASGTGAQRVTIANDSTGIIALTTGSAQIGHLEANQSVNVAQINGVATTMNNGAAGTGVQRVTIASDSTGNIATIGTSVTPGTGATNLGKAEDAAHTTADVGVMALAVRESSPTDLSAGNTNGDYEPLQVSRDGALWIASSAAPQGGWSVATGTIGATKTDIGTANTAGCVGGWYIYNPNASAVYVQFFNTQASGVTLGTTAPVYSLGIPATSAANVMSEAGNQHSTAICIAITTTRSGSTGPASTVDYNIWYKQ